MTDNSMRYENSEKVMHGTIVEVVDNQVSIKILYWLRQRHAFNGTSKVTSLNLQMSEYMYTSKLA